MQILLIRTYPGGQEILKAICKQLPLISALVPGGHYIGRQMIEASSSDPGGQTIGWQFDPLTVNSLPGGHMIG